MMYYNQIIKDSRLLSLLWYLYEKHTHKEITLSNIWNTCLELTWQLSISPSIACTFTNLHFIYVMQFHIYLKTRSFRMSNYEFAHNFQHSL